MSGKREYGDYQTPVEFAEKVCVYLKDFRHIEPSAIVEPTCGVGGFLKSSLLFNASEYYGIEINPEYCDICRNEIQDNRVKIINSDFFAFSSFSIFVIIYIPLLKYKCSLEKNSYIARQNWFERQGPHTFCM